MTDIMGVTSSETADLATYQLQGWLTLGLSNGRRIEVSKQGLQSGMNLLLLF